MTAPAREPLFQKSSRSHFAKDLAVVALAGLIVAGFLAHAWRPQIEPRTVAPAAFVALR